MCKKALVAGVAVVVSLLTVSFFCPTVCSHIKLWWQERQKEAQESIPPEKEIARLKMELDNLGREDERHFHKVAVQIVEVQNLDKQVAGLRTKLNEDELRVRKMKASYQAGLDAKEKQVSHSGKSYDLDQFREELRATAARFQVDEQLVKSKEEQLSLRKRNLEMNRKKLAELKLVRQQMKTELERLETALAVERQAQAEASNTLDDGSYLKLRKDLDSVRDKLEVMKQKQILRGEIDGPVRADEQRKEKEAAIDRFLNERFNEKQ